VNQFNNAGFYDNAAARVHARDAGEQHSRRSNANYDLQRIKKVRGEFSPRPINYLPARKR